MVLCGCRTASGGLTSIARIVTDRGAGIGLGWEEILRDGDAEEWMDRFGNALRRGYTIADAIGKANSYTKYEDPDAIRSTKGYAISTKYLNVSLDDYINGTAGLSNDEDLSDDISTVETIHEDVSYSVDSNDTGEIAQYIADNFDENFDINQFEVTDFTYAITDEENDVYTSVNLARKIGDFVTENGYYISFVNGKANKIFITGDPACHDDSIMLADINVDVDEDDLLDLALENIELNDGEKVEKQRILKKYDTEPYYVVITEIIDNNTDWSRSEAYEYRP